MLLISFLILGLSSCGATDSESSIMYQETHTHSYVTAVTEPTCTLEGYTLYKCSCGESYKDSIKNALGHNYIEREQNYKCSRCNRYEDDGFTFELITSEMARYNDSYKGRVDTYDIKSVSNKAVENGKVTLPKKHMGYPVTGIYRGALYKVRNTMTKLYIPSNIKYIGSNLVAYDGQFNIPNCTISLETIEFDNKCSYMSISHTAFQFCKNVANISMPVGCIKYFNHDDMVGNHFIFEDTLYYKNNRVENAGCFYIFDILTESNQSKVSSNLVVKAGTTIIANQAFVGNTNIKTVELPSSLKYIGKKAFAQCVSISTITYKGSESSYNSILIEDNAFQNCKTITYQFN